MESRLLEKKTVKTMNGIERVEKGFEVYLAQTRIPLNPAGRHLCSGYEAMMIFRQIPFYWIILRGTVVQEPSAIEKLNMARKLNELVLWSLS